MAFSYHNYTGDNSTTTFSIPFTYTNTSEISVTVDGVAETGLTFPSSSEVTLTSAPASGTLVQVRRTTTLTSRAIDFASGSVLTEEDLDNSNIQVFHAAQEANDKANDAITLDTDDKWDAQSKVIKNVAAPVANTDAVNKAFISTNLPNINTVAGINTEVTTVAGIASDVTAVVADQADIGVVAGLNTEIGLLGTSDAVSDMNLLATADIVSDMNTLATTSNVSNMNTLANISGDITTVSGIQANVTAVAGDEADIGTVATNIANVNTVAGIDGNVTTVAGIQANVTTVAGIQANVTTVASNDANVTAVAGNATNINTVAGQATNLQNVTDNLTAIQNAGQNATDASASQIAAAASASAAANSFDDFDDKYLGSKNLAADANPTVDNDGNALVAGALYFNQSANEMRVYDGGSWIAASSAGGASLLEYKYTATANQTTFTGSDDASNTLSYTVANLIVVLNGIVIENGSDYTATNGSSVVLASGAAVNDELNIIAFKSFTTADMVSATNGGAFSGNVAFGDNIKAIFGSGNDLSVYHNATHSYIDNNTGNIYIRSNVDDDDGGNIVLQAKAGESGIIIADDGAVSLYNNANLRLATSATGVDVTGGLNTTTQLTAQGPGGTGVNAALRIRDDTDQGATFGIQNDGDLVVSCETQDIIFDTNGTNRLRILSTGGITFNGDTAQENALDDYEEGTWTPTFSTNSGSAASAASVSGTYTKIGRLVTLNGSITNINTTGTTGTSQFLVTGMPYTTDVQDCFGAVSFNTVDLSTNADMVVMADASANLLVFMASRNNTGRTVVDHVHLVDDQADLMFTVSYITNQ